MHTLKDIEDLAKRYADRRTALAEKMESLEAVIERVKRKRLPAIRRAVEAAANDRAALQCALEDGKDLFVKPRTLVLHGIKVGIVKGKGKIEWEDDEQVVALIQKKLPDQADTLIKTTYKPIRAALAELSAADLKKIGVSVEEAGDYTLIKPAASDIDKLVDKLLAEADDRDAS